jgi:hypothetical protein
MPLFDTKHGFRRLDPEDIEEWDVLKKARKEFHPKTFDKMIRTTDEAIENINPSVKSNLKWTKSGAIFGYSSCEPVEAINHVWKHAIELWGDTKIPLLFVGSLLMWRISIRPEQWLTYASETGKIDPDSSKEITERSYWINEEVKTEYTAEDLKKKFNQRLR